MKAIFITLLIGNIVLFAWVELREPAVELGGPVALPEVGGIRLLAEVSPGATASEEVEEPGVLELDQPPESIVNDSQASLCTLLGPFDELLQAEYVVENLAAIDMVSKLERLEMPGEPGFWVYLPPLPSRKEALRKLHELQAKGVDSYVIPKGDVADGISFGMYSRKSSAEVRQSEVLAYGYKAVISEVPRSYEELWVVVRPGESKKLSASGWQNFINERKGLERQENYCPGIASL